jgi:GNAT superfamily N-acetyltransferase
LTIRPAAVDDIPAIAQLLGTPMRSLNDLTTPRMYPAPLVAKQRCLVADDGDQIVAVGASLVVTEGDVIVPSNSGHITALAAKSSSNEALRSIIRSLVSGLEGSGVERITAGNNMLNSGLLNPPAGALSSTRHATICTALQAIHFAASGTSLVLTRETHDCVPPDIPLGVHIRSAITEVLGHAVGDQPERYNLGYRLIVGEAFGGWCGAFNTRAFGDAGAPELYVHWLMTPSHARRLGHATLLMRHALSEARAAGLERVTLLTNAQNYGAQAFYRSLGFALADVTMEFEFRGPRLIDAVRDDLTDLDAYFRDDLTLTDAATAGTFGQRKAARSSDGLLLARALSEAARANSSRLIALLLSRGAYVNASVEDGSTALHAAAWEGHNEAVAALLSAGADPRLRDIVHDATAAGWASFAGHDDVATTLAHAEQPKGDPN